MRPEWIVSLWKPESEEDLQICSERATLDLIPYVHDAKRDATPVWSSQVAASRWRDSTVAP